MAAVARGRCTWLRLKRASGYVTYKRVEDAATEAKVAEGTVRKWIRAGVARTARTGKYVFVSMADVTRIATSPRGDGRIPEDLLVYSRRFHLRRQADTEPYAENHREPWDDDDEQYALIRLNEGADITTIAVELGRTYDSVEARLYVLKGRHWQPDPEVVKLARKYAREEALADAS